MFATHFIMLLILLMPLCPFPFMIPLLYYSISSFTDCIMLSILNLIKYIDLSFIKLKASKIRIMYTILAQTLYGTST